MGPLEQRVYNTSLSVMVCCEQTAMLPIREFAVEARGSKLWRANLVRFD